MIKRYLELQDVDAPKVGSTEEFQVYFLLDKSGRHREPLSKFAFQGREYAAIILSTVRTAPELAEFDRAHSIGFLDNPKRFNVAISRAKNLLVRRVANSAGTDMTSRLWWGTPGCFERTCTGHDF